MRILSSILLFLIGINLYAKQYDVSGENFSATLEIGAENFIEQPYFNLDITTSRDVKIELPEDFKNRFYVENFEVILQGAHKVERWILIIKEHKDFTLGAIKLSFKGEELSFDNIEFIGLDKEVQAPELNDIFIEKKSKLEYYVIFCVTLFTSIVLWIKTKQKKIEAVGLNLNDLYDTKDTKDFCEKLFVHLNKILSEKYAYPSSAKNAKDIAIFLREKSLLALADFIENSDEIMYANKSLDLDDILRIKLVKELERAWDKNEI